MIVSLDWILDLFYTRKFCWKIDQFVRHVQPWNWVRFNSDSGYFDGFLFYKVHSFRSIFWKLLNTRRKIARRHKGSLSLSTLIEALYYPSYFSSGRLTFVPLKRYGYFYHVPSSSRSITYDIFSCEANDEEERGRIRILRTFLASADETTLDLSRDFFLSLGERVRTLRCSISNANCAKDRVAQVGESSRNERDLNVFLHVSFYTADVSDRAPSEASCVFFISRNVYIIPHEYDKCSTVVWRI